MIIYTVFHLRKKSGRPHGEKRFTVLVNGLLIYNLQICLLSQENFLLAELKFCWDSKKVYSIIF